MSVIINGTTGIDKVQDGSIVQADLASGVAGTGPAFSAYQSSVQTLSSGTHTKLQFQTEEWDTNSCFDSTTNYRFTPNVAGYYQISGGFRGTTTTTAYELVLYKNGLQYKELYRVDSSNVNGAYGSCMVYLDGSTDYVELYGYVGTANAVSATSLSTYFQGALVRAA